MQKTVTTIPPWNCLIDLTLFCKRLANKWLAGSWREQSINFTFYSDNATPQQLLIWLKNWQEMWEWSHQDPHLAQKLGLILHNQCVNPSPFDMAACLQQTHFIKLKDHESGDLLSWQYPTGVRSHSPADTSGLVWQDMQYPNLLHEMQKYLLILKNP